MAFIAVNLDETQEQKAAPKGAYELQIVKAEEVVTSDRSTNPGKPMIKVTLGFTDLEVNAPAIQHYITLPYEGDEKASFKLLMLKRFLTAFDIPYSSDGIDTEALVFNMEGHTATLEVDLGEPNPETGMIYNTVRIPRIKEEMKSGTGKPPRRR